MKKIINFILTSLLVVLITLFFVSINMKKVVIYSLSKNYVSKEVTSELLHDIKDTYDIKNDETLERIENNFLNNENVVKITEKYFDGIINFLVYEKNSNVNTNNYLNNMINDNKEELEKLGIDVNEYKTDKLNIDKTYNLALKKVKNKLTKKDINMLKNYNKFISESFRIKLIIGIILILLIISIIKKSFYKWMYNFAIAGILSGVLLTFLSQVIVDTVKSQINYINLSDININSIINSGYICFAISFILVVIYLLCNKIVSKKS